MKKMIKISTYVFLFAILYSLNSCNSEPKDLEFKKLCQIAKDFNWKGERYERLSAFSHIVSSDIESIAIRDSVAALTSFHENRPGERYEMLIKGLKAAEVKVSDCPALKNNY